MHVSGLHDFHQTMWRGDALEALNIEANRVIAGQVCVGVIDDVLDWMLEGWVFGERPSSLAVAGFVPSINPNRYFNITVIGCVRLVSFRVTVLLSSGD